MGSKCSALMKRSVFVKVEFWKKQNRKPEFFFGVLYATDSSNLMKMPYSLFRMPEPQASNNG